jgi:hypothetical protein
MASGNHNGDAAGSSDRVLDLIKRRGAAAIS